jgi:uncharacterized protein (UPF0264 family)
MDSISGGADIIDVKNPKEGALGANFPRVIRQIKEILPKNLELSATLGDLPNLPGTASLAALGAVVSGVDYVKVGLFGVKTSEEATTLMTEVVKAVKDYDSNLKTIASGYADFQSVGCVSPLELPSVAYEAEADGILVDIHTKNGIDNLFSFLNDEQLRKFVTQAHKNNLLAALAGSLDTQHISRVHNLGTDIIGVRGAVCSKKDRLAGKLEKEKVATFVNQISKL